MELGTEAWSHYQHTVFWSGEGKGKSEAKLVEGRLWLAYKFSKNHCNDDYI